MADQLDALHASVDHLAELARPLTGDQLRSSAYPAEWTVGDVLSHLGSGAEIMRLRLQATLDGTEIDDDFAQPIWDEWNAKEPEAQRADSLAADAALLEVLDSMSPEQRAEITLPFGPMTADFAMLVGLRLNEHALHTWDIEVELRPDVGLPGYATELVVDQLEMIIRFTGRPTPAMRNVRIATTDPARTLTLSLGGDAVTLVPNDGTVTADLELPADALIRLVYGRLDPEHTPPVHGSVDLDDLRRAFPGV